MSERKPVETYEEFCNSFIEHLVKQLGIPKELLFAKTPNTPSAASILLPIARKYRKECEDFYKIKGYARWNDFVKSLKLEETDSEDDNKTQNT